MEHSEFPTDETLAAFIDGQLDEETRKQVAAHVADCDECYATVETARAWQQQDTRGEVFTRSSRRWYAAVAVAAAVAIAFLITPQVRERVAERELVAAANQRKERPATELRLSSDFGYVTQGSTNRGGSDDTKGEAKGQALSDARLATAVADVADRTESRSGRRSLHVRGLAELLAGYKEEAVKDLGAALGGSDDSTIRQSSNVDYLIDFGAAAYANGSYAVALEAYERASTLAPNSAAASYGLAATLQALGQRDKARAAWNHYLQLDPNSGWSKEARASLTALK